MVVRPLDLVTRLEFEGQLAMPHLAIFHDLAKKGAVNIPPESEFFTLNELFCLNQFFYLYFSVVLVQLL